MARVMLKRRSSFQPMGSPSSAKRAVKRRWPWAAWAIARGEGGGAERAGVVDEGKDGGAGGVVEADVFVPAVAGGDDDVAGREVGGGGGGAGAQRGVARGREPEDDVGDENDGGDGERAARAGGGGEPGEGQQEGPALGVAGEEGDADERVRQDPGGGGEAREGATHAGGEREGAGGTDGEADEDAGPRRFVRIGRVDQRLAGAVDAMNGVVRAADSGGRARRRRARRRRAPVARARRRARSGTRDRQDEEARAPAVDDERADRHEQQVLDVQQRRRGADEAGRDRPLAICKPQRGDEGAERGRVVSTSLPAESAPHDAASPSVAAHAARSLPCRRRARSPRSHAASAAATALTTRAGHTSSAGRVAPATRATTAQQRHVGEVPGIERARQRRLDVAEAVAVDHARRHARDTRRQRRRQRARGATWGRGSVC